MKRNPLLAKLMYYVKDIESFGTGIKRISDACVEAGVKVEFLKRKMGFAVVFYRPDDAVYDANIANNIVNSIVSNDKEKTMQKAIIAQMRDNPHITSKELAKTIGIAQRNIQVHIKSLKEQGFIERVGAKFGGHWVVNKPE